MMSLKGKTMMNERVKVFSEPDLEFRYGQKAKDPRDGLGLFGPLMQIFHLAHR